MRAPGNTDDCLAWNKMQDEDLIKRSSDAGATVTIGLLTKIGQVDVRRLTAKARIIYNLFYAWITFDVLGQKRKRSSAGEELRRQNCRLSLVKDLRPPKLGQPPCSEWTPKRPKRLKLWSYIFCQKKWTDSRTADHEATCPKEFQST